MNQLVKKKDKDNKQYDRDEAAVVIQKCKYQ